MKNSNYRQPAFKRPEEFQVRWPTFKRPEEFQGSPVNFQKTGRIPKYAGQLLKDRKNSKIRRPTFKRPGQFQILPAKFQRLGHFQPLASQISTTGPRCCKSTLGAAKKLHIHSRGGHDVTYPLPCWPRCYISTLVAAKKLHIHSLAGQLSTHRQTYNFCRPKSNFFHLRPEPAASRWFLLPEFFRKRHDVQESMLNLTPLVAWVRELTWFTFFEPYGPSHGVLPACPGDTIPRAIPWKPHLHAQERGT